MSLGRHSLLIIKWDLEKFFSKIGKSFTNHSLNLAKVFWQKHIPFKANSSPYFNTSQYSGETDKRKSLQDYNKVTDPQIHHLPRIQCIHQMSCKFQKCLMYANSISTINIIFNSMFNIFFFIYNCPKQLHNFLSRMFWNSIKTTSSHKGNLKAEKKELKFWYTSFCVPSWDFWCLRTSR